MKMGSAVAAARYDSVAMTLHWAIALLLGLDFAFALSFSHFDPGDVLYLPSAYDLHMSTGACVLALSLARVLWRLTHRHPPLPEMAAALRVLARISHFLLYVFMVLAPLSGWLVMSLRHQTTSVFGQFSWAWPSLPAIATMARADRARYHDALLPLHVWLSYLGMSLVALHVAAALYHQLWRRDAVLRRMLPGVAVLSGGGRRPGRQAGRGLGASLKLLALAVLVFPAIAVADTFRIDPNHTHPLFEVDHFDGLSTWRGLFKSTSGAITLDRARGTGTVDIVVDVTSIDLGHDKLNQLVVAAKIGDWNGLDTGHFPTAQYHGTLGGFVQGAPTTVSGELTLHGVSRPLALRIDSFKCIADHPIVKREVCGADAFGTFNRADFGVNAGLQYGFRQEVTLRIQVEAIRQD
jgi:cytochrome b561/polyisoprenoid-binding protein YceI